MSILKNCFPLWNSVIYENKFVNNKGIYSVFLCIFFTHAYLQKLRQLVGSNCSMEEKWVIANNMY